MSDYPSTARFFVIRDFERPADSPILEVMYRATPDAQPREFAHVWPVRGWRPADEGKWTFNRSDVCMANEWWPADYIHDTLADLLNHLEETFVEGVPANQPY